MPVCFDWLGERDVTVSGMTRLVSMEGVLLWPSPARAHQSLELRSNEAPSTSLRNPWDIGYKGGKGRDIDLLNRAREPLYDYLQATRGTARTYVFLSKREGRLTEQGIHYWFRTLKAQASSDQGVMIQELTFHDLRTDFAHRAREAGWSFQEVAHYLGYVHRGRCAC